MAGVDAGERVPCPSCGETVLQKAMIPVLGEDGTGIRYLCVTCARLLIVQTTDAEANGPEAAAAEAAESGTADGATGAGATGAGAAGAGAAGLPAEAAGATATGLPAA